MPDYKLDERKFKFADNVLTEFLDRAEKMLSDMDADGGFDDLPFAEKAALVAQHAQLLMTVYLSENGRF